jgi:hypothetical protein
MPKFVPPSNDELSAKLKKLSDTWDRCSSNRRRDAPYRYLVKVYRFYVQLKTKGGTIETVSRIAKLKKLPIRLRRNPFRTIIDATCTADEKSKSRMTRALRFAYKEKWGSDILTRLKEAGGIAGCAHKFARMNNKRK